MHRFQAFAPVVKTSAVTASPRTYAQPASVTLLSNRGPTDLRTSPLDEIQAIEEEWRLRIQPSGLVEETLCAQLAHATWHLRCLQRAEREAISVAAMNRAFNGETAASLMTWRLSSETAIRNALDQLQQYRSINEAEAAGSNSLLALRDAVRNATDRAALSVGA
jgi:hypothetical protein